MFGRMFKTPNHKQFDYRPRFYDPIKDELEERVRAHEARGVDEREARMMRINQGMRRNQGRSTIRAKSTVRSNIMIALIVFILALLAFFILGDLDLVNAIRG